MKPLPMPATSHLLAGSSLRAWMATDGTLALYGVNRPAGQPSMFIVAAMPMAALPQVAAQLRLIGDAGAMHRAVPGVCWGDKRTRRSATSGTPSQ